MSAGTADTGGTASGAGTSAGPGAATRPVADLRVQVGSAAGLLGGLATLGGSLVAAIAYTGTEGEAYSPFSHWVSELGELGVSALAPVFNVGLMIGGIGFTVFMTMLLLSMSGPLRFAYGPIGMASGVAGFLVGVFPMNVEGTHGNVAMAFFNLGWIAVGLVSIDIVLRRDPRFPRWLAVIGALTVLAFIAFLVSIRVDPLIGAYVLGTPVERPSLWTVPTLEWAVILGILAWTVCVAWTWRRAGR